jgi:hypothetical protein
MLVLESSPPAPTIVSRVVSQVPASVLIAEGRPLLAVAVDLGLVVVWFAAGPVQRVREGMRAAAPTVPEELYSRTGSGDDSDARGNGTRGPLCLARLANVRWPDEPSSARPLGCSQTSHF